MTRIDDALEAMSSREVEELMRKAKRRLSRCAMDPSHDGAVVVRITFHRSAGRGTVYASMMLCPACIERHRLPELRAGSGSPASEAGR